ncbi:MAG: MlaD family protein [Sphingobacteriaceae bacterium]
MKNQKGNNIKLGVFVLAGLVALIFTFFIIGKNNNLFGKNFRLKVSFTNLNGLTEGGNVLFSGIQAGTVKDIELVNDTTIVVTMQINSKVQSFMHKNALATIGTEGLMGNKVVNIQPVKGESALVQEGDTLGSGKMVNMDEIIEKLSQTNNNVASISEVLKGTVLRIDSSDILKLIDDKSIGISLKSSLKNVFNATKNANEMTRDLNIVVSDIKSGKGAAGLFLTDTDLASMLKDAVTNVTSASANANRMTLEMNNLVSELNKNLNSGKGPINTLLKDSTMANNLAQTMENLEKGTDGFHQNMEALKHNFLFRGYFRKLEKKRLKDDKLAN